MSTLMSTDLHVTRSSTRRHAPPGGSSSISFGWDDSGASAGATGARAGSAEEARERAREREREVAHGRLEETFRSHLNLGVGGDAGGAPPMSRSSAKAQTQAGTAATWEKQHQERALREVDMELLEIEAEMKGLEEQFQRLQAKKDILQRKKTNMTAALDRVSGTGRAAQEWNSHMHARRHEPPPVSAAGFDENTAVGRNSGERRSSGGGGGGSGAGGSLGNYMQNRGGEVPRYMATVESASEGYQRKTNSSATRYHDGAQSGGISSVSIAHDSPASQAHTSVRTWKGHNASSIGNW